MADLNRYFIKLSYNGKAYHGWQRQENAATVQQVLEEAIATIFEESIDITGAGRTDTGVHATEYYAHFDSENVYSEQELQDKVFKLNSFLPTDIYVFGIFGVDPELHARFSAHSRKYEYHITRRKDPFRRDLAWFVHGPLEIEMMNSAASVLMDYHDFTSFSKLHTQVKTNNCRIMEAYWEEQGHLLVFNIKADRFLRNMVRAIVGTLLDVGRGKISLEEFKAIIEAKDRSEAGLSVPAHGLYLVKIEYP
ncbi:MAG: tRNA pseudouridine(38-40) synthase TruA [Bacteroidales bacterium]|jgi:tRNA pseudouridine38-40 synthase|nr:tRNA pseudouridine(38-40) synthase TruA [Bacteroidales bacterium]